MLTYWVWLLLEYVDLQWYLPGPTLDYATNFYYDIYQIINVIMYFYCTPQDTPACNDQSIFVMANQI